MKHLTNMHHHFFPILLVLSLALFSVGSPALARPNDVTVRWQAVDGAVRYELRILKRKEPVLTQTTENADASWQGKLNPGLYSFEVRAIDWIGRPGDWSAPQPVVALPPAVTQSSPAIESTYALEAPPNESGQETMLVWKAIEGVDFYRLEVQREETEVLRIRLLAPQAMFPLSQAGKYRWRVTGILHEDDALFANDQYGDWDGPESPWWNFTVQAPPPKAIAPPETVEVQAPPEPTLLQVLPRISFWILDFREYQNSASSSIISDVNAGLAATISTPWRGGLAPFFNLELLQVSLFPPSGQGLNNRRQVLFGASLGMGWTPTKHARWHLALGVGPSEELFLSAQSYNTLQVEKHTLLVLQGRLAFDIFHRPNFRSGLELGLGTYFAGGGSDADAIHGGSRVMFKLYAAQTAGTVRLRGGVSFLQTSLHSDDLSLDKSDLGAEVGVDFRL